MCARVSSTSTSVTCVPGTPPTSRATQHPTMPAPTTVIRSPTSGPASHRALTAVCTVPARTARSGGTSSGTTVTASAGTTYAVWWGKETEDGAHPELVGTAVDDADVEVAGLHRAGEVALLKRCPHHVVLALRDSATEHQSLGAAAHSGPQRAHQHLARTRLRQLAPCESRPGWVRGSRTRALPSAPAPSSSRPDESKRRLYRMTVRTPEIRRHGALGWSSAQLGPGRPAHRLCLPARAPRCPRGDHRPRRVRLVGRCRLRSRPCRPACSRADALQPGRIGAGGQRDPGSRSPRLWGRGAHGGLVRGPGACGDPRGALDGGAGARRRRRPGRSAYRHHLGVRGALRHGGRRVPDHGPERVRRTWVGLVGARDGSGPVCVRGRRLGAAVAARSGAAAAVGQGGRRVRGRRADRCGGRHPARCRDRRDAACRAGPAGRVVRP